MTRTLLLAAMLLAAGVLGVFTLRQARSHFDVDFWYMLTSMACYGQKDPLNLLFTHYASADNVAWELDYHGYWPVTHDGDGYFQDHGYCREQKQQRLTDWFPEGGTEKKYHVRLWEGLDCEPATGRVKVTLP